MTETNSIGPNDVLCGRGGATNNHIGNKKFRAIVTEYQGQYLKAKKKEKALIARQIVERVNRNGGRFLKREDGTADVWVEVTEKKAIAKTSQALREGLDVRHQTVRAEKMPRRDSDSLDCNRRKKARLVEGRVIESPSMKGSSGEGVPDLAEESLSNVDPLLAYFEPPPRITKADCHELAAV